MWKSSMPGICRLYRGNFSGGPGMLVMAGLARMGGFRLCAL